MDEIGGSYSARITEDSRIRPDCARLRVPVAIYRKDPRFEDFIAGNCRASARSAIHTTVLDAASCPSWPLLSDST